MGSTWWPYVVLFLTVTASWAGVPAVGPAAIGAATVAASQNKLDLTAVVVVSAMAAGPRAGTPAHEAVTVRNSTTYGHHVLPIGLCLTCEPGTVNFA